MANLDIILSEDNKGIIDFSYINDESLQENERLRKICITNIEDSTDEDPYMTFEGNMDVTINRCLIYFSDNCFNTNSNILSGSYLTISNNNITKQYNSNTNTTFYYLRFSINGFYNFNSYRSIFDVYNTTTSNNFNTVNPFKEGIDFFPSVWIQFFYTENNSSEKSTDFILIPNKWPDDWSMKCSIHSWSTAYYTGLKYDTIFLEDLYFNLNESNIRLDILFYKDEILSNTYSFYFDQPCIVPFSSLWAQTSVEEEEESDRIPIFYKENYLDYQIKFRILPDDIIWEEEESGETPGSEEPNNENNGSEELTVENENENENEPQVPSTIPVNYETDILNYYPLISDVNYIKLIRYELVRDFDRVYMTFSSTGKYYLVKAQKIYSPYEETGGSLELNWMSWEKKEALENEPLNVINSGDILQGASEGFEIRKFFTFNNQPPFYLQSNEIIDHRFDEISTIEQISATNNILIYKDFYSVALNNNRIFSNKIEELTQTYFNITGSLKSTPVNITTDQIIPPSEEEDEEEFIAPKYLFISDKGVALGQNEIKNDNSFEVNSNLTTRLFGPAYFTNNTYINNRNIYNDLYYTPGTYTIYVRCGSYITSSATQIRFQCIPDKFLNLISTISIKNITGCARTIHGGYIFPFSGGRFANKNWLEDNFKATATKRGNKIFVTLTSKKGYYTNDKKRLYYCDYEETSSKPNSSNKITNNTPISLDLVIQFTFS